MLKKSLIILSVVIGGVILINIPYSSEEYTKDNLILQNNTGWNREIFSDYKTFDLLDNNGIPTYVIPYNLDVDIKDARFIGGNSVPVALNIIFDKPTKQKTMDILLPKVLEPKSTDLIFKSFRSDKFELYDTGGSVPLQFHSPLVKIKDYDTHTQYLVQLYNNTKSIAGLGNETIVLLPIDGVFFYESEPVVKSYWKLPSSDNFDYFAIPYSQHKIRADILCPKYFELAVDSNIPKCINSMTVLKSIMQTFDMR